MNCYFFRKKNILMMAASFWTTGNLLLAASLPDKVDALIAASSGWPGTHSRLSQSMIVHFRAESELELVSEFDLLSESRTAGVEAPDVYDPVRLTLSTSGDFLLPDRSADIIHPEIKKAYGIRSFRELERFLVETEFSEWKKYITFYSEDQPGQEKSIDEIRYLVSRKQEVKTCIL